MLRCEVCDEVISEERIKAFIAITNGKELPKHCETHSVTNEYFGLTVYSHKTAGDVVFMVNPTNEQKRQMLRAYERAR